MIFLDANVIIYYLDETADNHEATVDQLRNLIDDQEQLVTSHHVIEEVLFIISKLNPEADLEKAVARIGEIPGLILVEPSPDIEFAKRYAVLNQKLAMGLNDALLLQLILDAGIERLFSFDKQFVDRASKLHTC